jgi:hypothetical protein
MVLHSWSSMVEMAGSVATILSVRTPSPTMTLLAVDPLPIQPLPSTANFRMGLRLRWQYSRFPSYPSHRICRDCQHRGCSYSHNSDTPLHVSERANSDRLDFGLDLGSHDQQEEVEGGEQENLKQTATPEVLYRYAPDRVMEQCMRSF